MYILFCFFFDVAPSRVSHQPAQGRFVRGAFYQVVLLVLHLRYGLKPDCSSWRAGRFVGLNQLVNQHSSKLLAELNSPNDGPAPPNLDPRRARWLSWENKARRLFKGDPLARAVEGIYWSVRSSCHSDHRSVLHRCCPVNIHANPDTSVTLGEC